MHTSSLFQRSIIRGKKIWLKTKKVQVIPPVGLADPGDPAVHRLAAVHVLDGGLTEQKVDKILGLEGADKVGL